MQFCINIIKPSKHLQQFNQVIITIGVIIKDNKILIMTKPKAILIYLKILTTI